MREFRTCVAVLAASFIAASVIPAVANATTGRPYSPSPQSTSGQSTGSVRAAAVDTSATGHDPIVFVHGWVGADWNWAVMTERFRSDDWAADELHVWQYDWAQSNTVTARELADEIDRVLAETGADAVDLVTHSMGGLSSRHYLKFLDGTDHVNDWVSIGGPNHGTNAAYACTTTSCGEMRFDSAFLTRLNSGDETPGTTDYGTVWSACDEIINPDESVLLEGASNHRVSCIGHVSLVASEEVYETTRDFVS